MGVDMDEVAIPSVAAQPHGITAIGVFLLFGAVIAFLAGASLARCGTLLYGMWALNPYAYQERAPFGKPVGLLFLSLAVTLTFAGIGWLKHRRWGWQLAVAIIGTQLLGDSVNIFLGRIVPGIVGVAIAGAFLFYITRERISAIFVSAPILSVRPK
jgi:hypothetical protein